MKRCLRELLYACAILPVTAQTTTNFTATFVFEQDGDNTERFVTGFAGTGTVGSLGPTLVLLTMTQELLTKPDYASGTGPATVGLTLAFNRLDRISIAFDGVHNPDLPTLMVGGRVSGGTGAYSGATSAAGALRATLTLTRTSTSRLGYNVSLAGSMTMGGQTVNLAVTNAAVVQNATAIALDLSQSGTCSVPPLGNGTLTVRSIPYPLARNANVKFMEINLTCAFSASDSVQAFLIVTAVNGEQVPGPITITGGTGRFAGASGSARVTSLVEAGGRITVTTTGSITEAGSTTPVITSVNTASALPVSGVAQNTWIEIKGTNLAPASTPAGGTFWSNAPDFAQGRMPTEIGGVSVTVNGKPAYVWWFCSRATTPACATDQINVLTPLDDYEGQVMVVVKNGAASSGAFLVNQGPRVPSVLLFTARGDGVATHGDGSLVGATSLFPGASTPARRGETISLWAVGFGLPTTPLVAGSATQSGALPSTPACYMGGTTVQATIALVSPGLYQMNVPVPGNAAAGDHHFFCTFGSTSTPGALIAVQ